MLAEKLGRTVGELRSSMTQAEFSEWIGYYSYQLHQRELALDKAKRKSKAGDS